MKLPLLLITVAAGAQADQVFNLNYSVLPSAAGWTYIGLSPESSVVHAVPGGLDMNTLSGSNNSGFYSFPTTFDAGTMRVVGSEGSFGWCSAAETGIHVYVMCFSADSITAYTFGTVAFDTSSALHSYRMLAQEGVGMALYVDGASTPILTGGNLGDGTPSRIYFGDGTGFLETLM